MGAVKVLIVDDEQLVRWSVRYFLEKEGYLALEAASAEEALQILVSDNIDVMITDLRMPGMDGVKLIKKALEAAPYLNVFVITAFDDCEVVDSVLQAGALGVFSKPIQFNSLLNAIHGLARGGKNQRPGAGL